MKRKDGLLKSLIKIVGSEYVSDQEHVLVAYSRDTTPESESKPDYVVMPKTVEEVQRIVRLANRRGVPLTPYVSGTNVGGLTIPVKGGMVVDLRRMNRIVNIDPNSMIAVIEPAVTFGELIREIDPLGFRYPVPNAPHSVSVMLNALLEGHGNLSVICGSQADNIAGMEVVLPDGRLMRVGSCAVSPNWFSLYPLPHIGGLFIGWQGTTGIVTKMGIKLIPKPPAEDLILLGHKDFDHISRFMIQLSKTRTFDACVSQSWAMKVAGESPPGAPLPLKAKEDSEMYTYITITGNNEKDLEIRREIINEVCEEYEKAGLIQPIKLPEGTKPETLPSQKGWVGYSARRGGGLTWVGSYTPVAVWSKGLKEIIRIEEKYDLDPMAVSRIVDWGHYGMLRAIIPYNKADPDEVERCKNAQREIAKALLDMGAVIYKPPSWAAEMMWQRADPVYVQLLRRIKGMLDPNGIMNPGRLGL